LKLRTDFVTNSSSTSFGCALGSAITAALGAGAGIAAANAVDDFLEVSGEESVPVIPSGSSEEDVHPDDRELHREIEHYEREWEDLQRTLDPDDPSYDEARREYEDYIDYLENQREWQEYERHLEDVARREQAMREQAQETWLNGRQEDLREVMEQRSMVEAVRDGYGREGFDVGEHDRRIEQLNRRERELRDLLRDYDADIDHTPRQRDPIGPSDEMIEARREREELLRQQREAEEAAIQARREEIAREVQRAAEEFERHSNSARRWDYLTRFTELVKAGADIGVDVLATVTGPAGQKVRTAYMGLSEVGQGVGESMAEGGNVVDNVGRGLLRGGDKIVRDRLGNKDRYGRYTGHIYNVGSDAVQGGYTAHREGESVLDGAMGGAGQGILDAASGEFKDALVPDLDLDVDLAHTNLADIPGDVARETLSHAIRDKTTGEIIGWVRGEDLFFEGTSHGYMQ